MALPGGSPGQTGISGLVIFAAGIATALLVLVAVAGTVFLVTGEGDGATTTVPRFTVPDGEPTPVPAERIRVVATSFLPDRDGLSYGPPNLLDGDVATAWNSNAGQSEGRGEVLTFRFIEPVDLTGIRFVNGYAKSDTVFEANHRVRDMMVRTDGVEREVMLMDIADEQAVVFDFGLTSKVEIEITEIYPGDGFASADISSDLAMSEVVFIAVQR